jgi:hypothetical protein
MIPTPENRKKLQEKKLQIHKKISNSFIQSALAKKTISSLKIIYYLASILKKEELDYSKVLNTIVIDTKDMLKYTELKMSDINNNFKKMQETNISFFNEEQEFEEHIVLIPRIKFHLGKNRRIEIDIYTKIINLIIDVTEQYTFINTKELMKLKNKHSIRLLPLLHTINNYDVKQKTLTISELNALFDTKYTAYELERSLLLKVKKELDNNSKLSFEYEVNSDVIGTGRPKVTSITFKPILKANYQSTIFTNFDMESIEQNTELDRTKQILKDDLYCKKIKREFGIDEQELMDEIKVFLDYCDKNNKQYKDIAKSFYTHLKNNPMRA